MSLDPSHHPGDVILNRYLPDASEEARADAREKLRAFALLMIRIGSRLEDEGYAGGDSPELEGHRKIDPIRP